jgi:hypothetical protein
MSAQNTLVFEWSNVLRLKPPRSAVSGFEQWRRSSEAPLRETDSWK